MSDSDQGPPPTDLFVEHTWLQGSTLCSVGYGVVLTLFFMCFHLLVQQMNAQNRKQHLGFLLYISCMFICATLFEAATAKMTELSFIDHRNFPGGPASYEVVFFTTPVNNMGNIAFVISNWFADGLMLWRYIVIFKNSRLPIWATALVPTLGFLGSWTLGLLFMIQLCAPAGSLWNAPNAINWTLPFLSMTVSLNFFITLLIVIRLWFFRHRITRVLGAAHGSQYTGIAALLVESSFIYSVFSLLLIIPFAKGSPIQNLFIQALGQVQVISPFLIIFRVCQGKAWGADTETRMMSSKTSGTVMPMRIPTSQSKMTQSGTQGTISDGIYVTKEQLSDGKSYPV